MSQCNLLVQNDGQFTRRGLKSVIELILKSADLVHKADKCVNLTHEHIISEHVAVLFDAKVDKSNAKGPTINVRGPEKKLTRTKGRSEWQQKSRIGRYIRLAT